MILSRDLVLVAVLVLADFLSKGFFFSYFGSVCNAGGPWGTDIPNSIMIASATLFVILAFFFHVLVLFPFLRFASLLIVAGGVGNLIDRTLFGCVRDFPFIPGFPAFNGADLLLTLGGIVAVYAILAERRAENGDDML